MLRKLIVFAITAGLAKRAWNQYRSGEGNPRTGSQPLGTPDASTSAMSGAGGVSAAANDRPVAWH